VCCSSSPKSVTSLVEEISEADHEDLSIEKIESEMKNRLKQLLESKDELTHTLGQGHDDAVRLLVKVKGLAVKVSDYTNLPHLREALQDVNITNSSLRDKFILDLTELSTKELKLITNLEECVKTS